MNNRIKNLNNFSNIATIVEENKFPVILQRELTLQILTILNKQSSKIDIIREVLCEIKKQTGNDAVGIRLKNGDDFPYYETSGFSDNFVRAESSVCAIDHNGKPLFDKNGNNCLECFCGDVLRGRFNSALSVFTSLGSFWTNSTTELLSTRSSELLQTRTRNRCNKDGYESVALIPLIAGYEIIGLLQLNDRRKNRFTRSDIDYFEELGNSIGVAMSRKHAEEIKEKSSRAFQMLSECNQVLIKTKNELSLLTDVCELIVKIGGYSLAWVGFAENDEDKTVKMVAQMGNENKYLENLNVSWDNSELGQGPTGKAIQSKKPQIVKNMLTNIDSKPWRDAALSNSYQSSIALPLIGNSGVIGALNIYSSDPDGFEHNEVIVLTRLAENLAYGIETLKSTSKRQVIEEKLHNSENKLLEAQKIAQLGYYVFNITTGFWTSSKELDAIFGMNNSCTKDMPYWLSTVHPDHREMMSSYLLNDILRQNKKFDKEYKIIDTNTGEVKWGHGLGNLKFDDDGNPTEMFGTIQDITEHKKAEKALEESNIALKEILSTIETEKKEQLLSVQAHVNRTVLPLVRKLEIGASEFQANYISLIIENLKTVVSPFVGKLEARFINLSPREIEICKMLKDGMTSKEIAETLNTSVGTVFNQRKAIRKKLNISNDKVNLITFLNSI